MIDENAFGLLFSYHGLEDDEYADDDLRRFVERVALFQRVVLGYLEEKPPGRGVSATDLGHAIYIELPEGEESGNLISWLRTGATRLREQELRVACFLTHGGRWVSEGPEEGLPEDHSAGAIRVTSVSKPSEPLRRALYAETASHGLPDEASAWGPGVYIDIDAVQAMGLTPKNQPTTLDVAGAQFFRIGG